VTVDIHFAGGDKPVRTGVSYDAEGLARRLSNNDGSPQWVGNYLEVRLLNDEKILVNPNNVAFLADVK